MKNRTKITDSSEHFESIKHIDENGNEYWLARELQDILEYVQWRRFEDVINKARISCQNSGIENDDHFVNIGKTIKMPKSAIKTVNDYKLTRYACYLIAQNDDSRKQFIALTQTYFALQTRKQELTELEYANLSEDERRLYKRDNTRKANYFLQQTARESVIN